MTDYFFARPSFWDGMARCLDLGDTLSEFNMSISDQEADTIAIQADWRAVGQDIFAALRIYPSTRR